MAANFASASSQRLINTVPAVTGYPITVGVWVYLFETTIDETAWSLCDTGTANNFLTIRVNASSSFAITCAAGGAENVSGIAALAANDWTFLLGRFISATSRRLSLLRGNGLFSDVQSTTNLTPTGLDTMSIGSTESSSPTNFFNGRIGEVWYTGTDIQGDGAALQVPLLRQLAYGGPFSIPSIAKDIIDYRSMRVHPDSRGDQMGEVYHGAAGRQTWTNTNGVTAGPHPPLPYWHKGPDASTRTLVA